MEEAMFWPWATSLNIAKMNSDTELLSSVSCFVAYKQYVSSLISNPDGLKAHLANNVNVVGTK